MAHVSRNIFKHVIAYDPYLIDGDFPQPEGPTSTQNSPSAIATSTPRITCVDPKRFCTRRMSTAAIRLLSPTLSACRR